MASLRDYSLRHMNATFAPSSAPRLFNGDRSTELGYEVYGQYYEYQWRLFSGHNTTTCRPTQNPENTFRLVHHLHNGKAREELKELLKSTISSATDEECERSMDLAARLLTMLWIGVPKDQVMARRCLRWEQGTIRDFVSDFFKEAPKLSYERVRLPKSFNAWSISKIAGINISFTDNLADHLLLTDDDSTLLIFHHVSFLECHLQPNSTIVTPLYPAGLIHETLSTIALLFPQSEFALATRRSRSRQKSWWLRNVRLAHEQSGQHPTALDPRLALCGTLQAHDRQIERFHFWRDRLVILKQTYDDATPSSLKQWWHDRRNGVQWYTFWVAVLVLLTTTVLSLLQTVAAFLQVYQAYVTTAEVRGAVCPQGKSA
ncbi:hypothetical protein QBC41DRAFT_343220 [Cercophora samala]|uniref:Uncharacterized protein n=1 Tax=Cercophora samala TaxID=330535 RepID=A0AA39ZL96_9PEZI|nr:hypothetical protein QBC41DRAFT_343220 [Cercophora samala]